MTISGHLHQSLQLSYRLGVLRGGKVVSETATNPHMITDAGLDQIGTTAALAHLAKCILGTNATPTPIRRDDGAVTFSQAGNTITASSAFFVAADVGRLFKWGSGTAGAEVYITSFLSSTSVEVSASASVASSVGTVWYVNTAALLSPVAGLTWTKQTTGNGSVGNVVGNTCTVTHTTINVSSPLAAPATVTELAISDSTTNAAVFDRDVISPPVAMLTGDQAVVTIELVETYAPVETPEAVANVATGYDSSGTAKIESLGLGSSGLPTLTADGNFIDYDKYLLPHVSPQIAVVMSAFELQPFGLTSGPASGSNFSMTMASYGSGSRYRNSTYVFPITAANGTIYGVSMCAGTTRRFTLKFAAPFTKLNTQTLSFTFRKSWSRVLTN